MITAEELKQYGKVEKCDVIDDKLHILITDGFSINANNTFDLFNKIIQKSGEYQIIETCITDTNLFNLILKKKEEYELVQCDCPCHKNSGVRHVRPCCYNGYKQVPKGWGLKK